MLYAAISCHSTAASADINPLTTMAYCPIVKAFAALAGPWMSLSFFLSFLAFFKLGTLFRNFSLGFAGRTTSSGMETNTSQKQRYNTSPGS